MATQAILHKLEHIMTLLVYTRTIRRTRACIVQMYVKCIAITETITTYK